MLPEPYPWGIAIVVNQVRSCLCTLNSGGKVGAMQGGGAVKRAYSAKSGEITAKPKLDPRLRRVLLLPAVHPLCPFCAY